MIGAEIPSSQIINEYGLAVWLVVLFCIGLFIFTFWLVKYLLKSHEKERELHQKFFSEAIQSNTQALVTTADKLAEATLSIRYSMEALGRIESITKSAREDHQILQTTQVSIHKDMFGLNTRMEGLEKLQEQCQNICRDNKS